MMYPKVVSKHVCLGVGPLHRPQLPTLVRQSSLRVGHRPRATSSSANGSTLWSHILVTLVDSNASLSTASRSTLDTAALLAQGGNKLTVMFLDEVEGTDAATSPEVNQKAVGRAQRVQEELASKGCKDVHFIEETIEQSSGKGSVAVGEAVDSVGADLVLLHTAAVHDKLIDANLLAEFCDANLLLLP